jgi:hypothetical protein
MYAFLDGFDVGYKAGVRDAGGNVRDIRPPLPDNPRPRRTRNGYEAPRRNRYVLVYQGGLANVFQVKSFNLSDYGREARRLLQSDFKTAESFARGIAAAGGIVKSAASNRAGDIIHEQWTEDLDSQPFSDKFRPVDNSKGLSING